jgi:hypothetical protein
MGSTTDIETVDDLAYDLPQSILDYDKRFWLGLTATDIITIAGFGLLLGFVHVLLGFVGALVGLFLVVRFDALGNQSLIRFAFGYVRHRATQRPVVLPIILPASDEVESFSIIDADGGEYRFGDVS